MVSVTITEPRFSRADVELLLASRRAERAPRNPYGVLLSEATDPAMKGRWVIPNPSRDFPAQMLHARQAEYRKKYPDADHGSLLWRVDRTEE